MEILELKEKFCTLYRSLIKRDGAEDLLEYLCGSGSDFFTAPASTRFHGNYPGGLCEHSLNVFQCLNEYLARPYTKTLFSNEYTPETIAIVSLLLDL